MKNTHLYLKSAFVALFFLVGSGCFKNHEDLVPILGKPSGGIREVKIESVNGNRATIRVRLFALNQLGRFLRNLDEDKFEFENAPFSANFTDIEEADEKNRPEYSALLLFDQSGSMDSNDPDDARITAGKAFIDLLEDDEEAAVAVFSGSSPDYDYPWTLLEKFTTKESDLRKPVEEMDGKEGNSTPLYISMYELLDYIEDDANNSNKALIAFTDGEDNDSGGIGPQDIIDRARQHGIEVYTVGLINYDTPELTEIALGTNGAVMLAGDALQLVSLYSSLGDMLRGRGEYMDVTFTATLPAGQTWEDDWYGQVVKMRYEPTDDIGIDYEIYIPEPE